MREEPNGFNKNDVKKCVIHYLNEIFTKDDRESSIKVWEFLTETIRKKFDVFIEKDIIQKVNLRALCYRVAKYLNLVYNPEYDPMNLDNPYPFNLDDLIDIEPRVKIPFEQVFCINIALKKARENDFKGKRTKWYV